MINQDVFRFCSLRGIQKSKKQESTFFSDQETALTVILHSISDLDDEKVISACDEYTKTASYTLEPNQPYDLIQDMLELSTIGEAKQKFIDVTGENLDSYIESDTFKQIREKQWDTYYSTIKLYELRGNLSKIREILLVSNYLSWVANLDDDQENMDVDRLNNYRLECPIVFYPTTSQNGSEGSENLVMQYTQRNEDDLNKIQRLTELAHLIQFKNESKAASIEIEVENEEIVDEEQNVIVNRQQIKTADPWIYDDKEISEFESELIDELKSLPAYKDKGDIIDIVEGARNQAIFIADRIIEQTPAAPLTQLLASDQRLRNVLKMTGFDIMPNPKEVPGGKYVIGILPIPTLPSVSIGDLFIVRQRLRGYQLGEIAHIQNVLATEAYRREHARLEETEDTLLTDFQQTTETENHLETTDRFELTREVKKSIDARRKRSAGFSISASYGPVSATARTDSSSENAVQESLQTSEHYAKEIVSETIERISTSVRETRTQRVLERYEEKNEHSFDNSSGSENVTGIYRWVEKKYENILVNYGKRLMIEFVIPEPAAFYLASRASAPDGLEIQKPQRPTYRGRPLRPSDLTAYNYQYIATPYRVQNIESYPVSQKAVAATISKLVNSSGNAPFSEKQTLTLDDGYRVSSWRGSTEGIRRGGFTLNIILAGQMWHLAKIVGKTGSFDLSATGSLMAVQANLSVTQEITDEKRRAWQDSTYGKIMAAYDAQLTDYNNAVSAFESEEQQEITSRPEATIAEIEVNEVKKGAIRALSEEFRKIKVNGKWLYDIRFDAMKDNGGFGYPEFDTDEAMSEAQIVKFFEQAFEWDNMTYFHYPYFWARKEKWIEMSIRQDDNKQFERFLRAGATRVVVPVLPAHAKNALHFIKTKEIWQGDDPPVLGDDDFVSVADEIEAQTNYNPPEKLPRCGEKVDPPCIVRTWESTLPTSLISLQEGTRLPSFDGAQASVDIEEILDKKAEKIGNDLSWRSSIVDLLKVIGLDSSLSARRELAIELGYDPDKANNGPTRPMNIWLHARVLDILIEHVGEWPK